MGDGAKLQKVAQPPIWTSIIHPTTTSRHRPSRAIAQSHVSSTASKMKQFWSWPAFLRLVLANQQPFNVFDDLYAFPQARLPPPQIASTNSLQYEIDWLDHLPIKNSSADQLLSLHRQHTVPVHEPPSSPTTGLVLESRTSPPRPAIEPGSDAPTSSPHSETYEVLMHAGQRYLCGMPSADALAAASASDAADGAAPANRTAADEAGELSLATARGRELLAGMEGSCIYFVSGWWSYSFCYNESVRQFHPLPTGRNVPVYPPQEDRSVDAYVLGRFDARAQPRRGQKSIGERSVAELEVKGQTRYLVHHLKGGTVCDLTGEERSVEVQFRCDSTAPTDKISLIKETAICQYRMVISTPRLCNDVAFQPPATVKPWRISCNPIVPEDGMEEYIQRKAHEIGVASQEPAGLAENDAAADFLKMLGIDIKDITGDGGQLFREGKDGKLVELAGKPRKVGGIEVGGHNILPEGTKLEKGSVVGGRDKFLMTVAASDGFTASAKDLARLKLRGFEAIDEMKRKVEAAADGAAWRLDVDETAQGPQLKAIIGEGALEGEEKGEKKKGKNAKEAKDKAKTKEKQEGQEKPKKTEETPKVDEMAAVDDSTDGQEDVDETYKEEL